MTSEYLNEFEKLNTTTESIYDLGDFNVLIILNDGTNLTDWNDVKNKQDIIYISEDLTNHTTLKEKYKGLKSLKAIVTSDLPDKITELNSMFYGCSSLVDVGGLGSWDTQDVTNMSGMFAGCSSLVDVGGLGCWDTQNVFDMSGMFRGCSSLVDVGGLGSWDTQNVTNMYGMFCGCSSLVDVGGLGSWDTQNVTNMSDMFLKCVFVKIYPQWY